MPRCPATKRDGGQCTTIVKPPQTHCYQHDPERAEERRRNASRAARSGGKEIRDLKRRILEVIDAVLEGSQERGRAAVAIQGLNALRGVLELERKVKETDELEARLEALEQPQEGGRSWGA
jgi:broad specificity phosphatase PhoE